MNETEAAEYDNAGPCPDCGRGAHYDHAAAWLADDLESATKHATDLRTWLAGGGFPPDSPNAIYFLGRFEDDMVTAIRL
jgi:hypothetical protein